MINYDTAATPQGLAWGLQAIWRGIARRFNRERELIVLRNMVGFLTESMRHDRKLYDDVTRERDNRIVELEAPMKKARRSGPKVTALKKTVI